MCALGLNLTWDRLFTFANAPSFSMSILW